MIVISDTNILSSLAAGAAFSTLFQLFARSTLCILPAVLHELQTGMASVEHLVISPERQAAIFAPQRRHS